MKEMDIDKLLESFHVKAINQDMYKNVKECWDAVAKPIDSMGKFEHIISNIGAIQDTISPRMGKTVILVYGADNGIVEEGISQSEQDVTAICTDNIAKGLTSVCVMAKANGIEVQAVDVGVHDPVHEAGILDYKVRKGSRNFMKEAAMTKEEMHMAVETGIRLARRYKSNGYDLIGIGEIGIGNTTTSSAVAASLLKCPAQDVTGRGAGLSDDKLKHKIEIIDLAKDKYQLEEKSPFEILQTVGGFDIAAMVGTIIGAAMFEIPVVLDGFISMVAALVAEKTFPGIYEYLIPSHMSKEPAAQLIAKELHLDPVINANMALGEGTGAVLIISLLKTANEVYRSTCLFNQVGIEQYERF